MLRHFIAIIIFFPFLAIAQNECNIWYFGDYAGIDFNGPVPVVLTNSSMTAAEGCASICNSNGSLLFYSNGVTVWNSNHQVMANGSGLLGNVSASQSCLIVKKPGSSTKYFIFTVDEFVGSNGIRYSEVDMSLQSGLGAINSNKNILIETNSCEKITAIRHQNNTDFWIVTHLFSSNTFNCYLLSSTGLSATPVTSSLGTAVTNSAFNSVGYLKASHDGTHLVQAIMHCNIFEIYDFDKASGLITNPLTITFTNGEKPYGVEFSPNCNLLYISAFPTNNIYQYNLQAGSGIDITNSQTLLGNSISSIHQDGALQLAPNGKIYHATWNSSYLGAINNPNTLGVGCTYVPNDLYLNGKLSKLGLPAFYNTVSLNNSNYDTVLIEICAGDSIFAEGQYQTSTGFYFDTLTSINNADSIICTVLTVTPPFIDNINITICEGDSVFAAGKYQTSAGLYTDSLNTINNCDSIINTEITVISAIHDTTNISLCYGDSFFTGGTYQSIAGLYSDTLKTIYYCDSIVHTNLTFRPPLDINLGADTTICQGDVLDIDAGNEGAVYNWSTGENSQTITIFNSGKYWVKVNINGCFESDTINIFQINGFTLDPEILLCNGVLDPKIIADSYLWSTGETTPSISVVGEGIFWLEVEIQQCTFRDSAYVISIPPAIIYTPNSFTPNGDGLNDKFKPIINYTENYNLKIFSSWGQLIYQTNDVGMAWDGTYNNSPVEQGVYVWVLSYYSSCSDKKFIKKGTVHLIR